MIPARARKPRRKDATELDFQAKLDAKLTPRTRKGSATPTQRVYGTVGSFSTVNDQGEILDDPLFFRRLQAVKRQKNKTASLFMDDGPADIMDSGNLQAYNFEFPNDAMEQAQSRREELRYYRIAYDRDPLVNRGINFHTELPLSKLFLEKPKCSVESFADFVFDWFQGWVNEVNLFEQLLHATREHVLTGEAFIFLEQGETFESSPLCPVAKRQLDRKERMRGPSSETNNPTEGVDELSTYRWVAPKRTSALLKQARDLGLVTADDRLVPIDRAMTLLDQSIREKRATLQAKVASLKTAAPGDEPQPMMESPLQRLQNMRGGGEGAPPAEGQEDPLTGAPTDPGGDPASEGDGLPGGDGGPDAGGDLGMGDDGLGMGGDLGMGGGMGGGGPMGDPLMGGPEGPAPEDPKITKLRRYLSLLEKKKSLLEELKTIKEEKAREWELFSHVVNQDFFGPERIVLLPPDVVEIKRDKRFNSEPVVHFRPSEAQKASYLEDTNVSPQDKETLESEGIVPLNDDPNEGSYVLHFARKKAPFEDHGRSILQCVMRTIIYRDKLRQAQNMLASRNLTPKTLVVAPDAPVQELDALRVHVDEAKSDPDYTIVVNYEVTWNEIGTDGRLLALDSEWAHTSAELAVGLGFTPEILTGEGFFSGDRIRVELLNTSYLQYRDTLADLVETKIFRPMAMRKGFYEIDDFGNPRWIYPKLSFSRLALRDQGDVYDMLFNLYTKGSLPVDIIYEFLNLDPETCKRKLEEDLLTVKDAKFNQILDAIYSGLSETLIKSTDIVDKVSKSLQLRQKSEEEQTGVEGSGEGM